MKHFLLCISLTLCVLLNGCAELRAQPTTSITGFDKPILFAYGSWEGRAKVENGSLIVAAPNNQGGSGDNIEADFSALADASPVLKLMIGANNEAKMLRLMLRDDRGGNATWNFSLEGRKTGEAIVLTPVEGASLVEPNEVGKEGKPDLSKIRQFQVQGNWSGHLVDVSIDAVELRSPDDALRAARAERVKRLADEAEKLRLERISLKARYQPGAATSPVVENVAPVAADVLAIEIEAGRVLPASLTRYTRQDGDTTRETKDESGQITSVVVKRGDKEIGWLIGPKREWLTLFESFEGDPLLEFVADDAANFSVSSPDDAAFAQAVKPVAVHRKSKPTNWAQGIDQFSLRHTIYLRLPRPLTPGKQYSVHLGELNTRLSRVEFVNAAAKIRSEAVHVNQIGFRPDDPAKHAFVSCWMGTGGALSLPQTLMFSLLDHKTGKTVFSGQSQSLWKADKPELMAREVNFNGTDVMRLDFSGFKTPGRYRVSVAGIGSSYPFEIGPDVWRRAFLIQMKGLYNQRTGMELGPPYTPFKKPRDMHPADGYPVTKTKYRAVEKGNEAWADIPAGDTGEKIPGGWGGYHDAGDWNPRRVSHMKVTMAQLEVFEMFPEYFAALKLNIPPTKGVPDVLAEAIWEFECFHRLQQKDGGVPYGMESGGDPLPGEVSWMNSQPTYVFTADYANSWYYAAVGARLAFLLQPYDPKRAATYRASALAAFEFAEQDFARDKAAGQTGTRGNTWEAMDNRNLAALELYRLTRDKKWHDRFLEDTVLKDEKPDLFQWGKHVQREHAFLYARLPQGVGYADWKKKAVVATEDMAGRALAYAANNAFNLTTPDKGKPQFIGFYTAPDALDLTRAHFLTGQTKYLAGAVQSTQFQSGANPNNIVYTTGLGANPVKNAFKLDARRTGQPIPAGLTPFGNVDLGKWGEQGWINWPITWFLSKNTTPDPYAWPTHEAYWDLGGWPALNEYVVDAWAPNIQVWGYLAARKPQQ